MNMIAKVAKATAARAILGVYLCNHIYISTVSIYSTTQHAIAGAPPLIIAPLTHRWISAIHHRGLDLQCLLDQYSQD